jgi:uncharacterized protein
MRFLRQKTSFFDLFDAAAANLVAIAEELSEMLRQFDRLPERQGRIKALEHRGDEFTHDLARQMHATFVTPLDREDISALYSGLDDVADYVDAAADRILLYRIETGSPEAQELGEVLVALTKLVQEAVSYLRRLGEKDRILAVCEQIHQLENQSDTLYRRALGGLFNAPGADPIFVIKWKEIYERLEMAADKCEDVANVVEGIQLKYG